VAGEGGSSAERECENGRGGEGEADEEYVDGGYFEYRNDSDNSGGYFENGDDGDDGGRYLEDRNDRDGGEGYLEDRIDNNDEVDYDDGVTGSQRPNDGVGQAQDPGWTECALLACESDDHAFTVRSELHDSTVDDTGSQSESYGH